jgi:hypothetical protein
MINSCINMHINATNNQISFSKKNRRRKDKSNKHLEIIIFYTFTHYYYLDDKYTEKL